MLILAAVSVLVSTANAKPVFKSDMTFLLEEAVQEFISRGIPVPEELQAKIEWSEAYDLELQKNIEKCENDLKERAKEYQNWSIKKVYLCPLLLQSRVISRMLTLVFNRLSMQTGTGGPQQYGTPTCLPATSLPSLIYMLPVK